MPQCKGLDDGCSPRVDFFKHQMKAEKQKVLLLINNCSAHKNVPRDAENIIVLFLSPVSQPLNQGIIHAAEVHYRSQLLWQMLASISVGHV